MVQGIEDRISPHPRAVQKSSREEDRDRNLKGSKDRISHLEEITITVVNSELNDAAKATRTAEASTIASTCAKVISGKSEFAAVVIVHVDYVKRLGNSSTVIDGIDFNKAPDGAFRLHIT